MQTLQASRQLIKYFPVHESTADSDTQTTAEIDQLIQSTLASAETQENLRHLQRHHIYNEETGKDSPWIQFTGWQRRFNNCDMSEWAKLIELKLASGEEEVYGSVNKKVVEMIEQAYSGKI